MDHPVSASDETPVLSCLTSSTTQFVESEVKQTEMEVESVVVPADEFVGTACESSLPLANLPSIQGDLYNVSLTDVDGQHGNRLEKLMRIKDVKEWESSDGFMVLITEVWMLQDTFRFSRLEGWIVLSNVNELYMHKEQFLAVDTRKYRLLSVHPVETMFPELRKQRQ